MEPESPAPTDAGRKDRQQRLDAIRSLAARQMETPASTSQAIGASRGRRRQALTWGSTVLLVGIIIAVIISLVRGARITTPQTSAHSPDMLQFPLGHIACPLSASWAPSGKVLAVVGYTVCSTQDDVAQGVHPIVSLYDVASGRETAILPLESALVRDATHGAALDAYQLGLGSAVWTMDSQAIGVMFTLSPTSQPGKVIYGLAVLHVNGSATAIVPASPLGLVGVSFETYNLYTTVPPMVVRFDVANVSVSTVAPQPSLFYQWDPPGTLAPSARPDAQAKTLPTSISGVVSYVCSSSGDASAHGNSAYFWISAGGSAWSPDDQYFFSTLGAYGRLTNSLPAAASQAAAPSQQSCVVAGPSTKWPAVTMPLGGLASAEHGLDPYNTTQFNFVTSPDNSRIAVSEQAGATTEGSLTPNEQTVSVYDTATSKLVARFAAPQLLKQAHVATDQAGELFTSMSWSPDAHSLAVLDTADRVLIILGPSKLHG